MEKYLNDNFSNLNAYEKRDLKRVFAILLFDIIFTISVVAFYVTKFTVFIQDEKVYYGASIIVGVSIIFYLIRSIKSYKD